MEHILLNEKVLECSFLPCFCLFVHLSTIYLLPLAEQNPNTTFTRRVSRSHVRMLDGWMMGHIEEEYVWQCRNRDPKEKVIFHRLATSLILNISQSFHLACKMALAGICH